MICSNCGREIKDNAKFCMFCGNKAGNQTVSNENIEDNSKQDEAKKELKNIAKERSVQSVSDEKDNKSNKVKNTKIIVGVSIVAICLLGLAIIGINFFSKKNASNSLMDVNDASSIDESIEVEKTNDSSVDNNSKSLSQEKMAVLEYIFNSANDDMTMEALNVLFEELISFAGENDAGEYISDRIQPYFDSYVTYTKEGIQFLNDMDARPPLYIQMKSDYNKAKTIVQELENVQIIVDTSEFDKIENELFDGKYKDRLINVFDSEIEKTISENGVVSRSTAWSIMDMCNETGLYEENDFDDALHIRYMTALALKVDSELANMDTSEAIKKLYEVIPITDYNPLLVYFLADVYGDENAKYCMGLIYKVIPEFETLDIGGKRNYVIDFMNKEAERKQIRVLLQDNF